MNEQIIDLAQQLIRIPSVSGDQINIDKALDLITGQLNDFHIKTFNHNQVVSVLISNQKTDRFKLILNAHIDVVPAKPDQFQPKIKGNRLYGRGAYDMKAATAVFVELFKQHAANVDYPIALQIVSDEETGGFNGTFHQVEEGIRSDFVIVGEPTNLDVAHAARGVYRVKLTARGKAAHGGYPWNGDNALIKLNNSIYQLLKKYPIPKQATWASTINVANITTPNTFYNKIPDKATAMLDARFIYEDNQKILDDINSIAKKYDLTIQQDPHNPARYTPKDHPMIQNLITNINIHTHKKPELYKAYGGSDLAFYFPTGCHGIEFGPVGAGHHTIDEWVDINSLNDYYQILKDYLINLK